MSEQRSGVGLISRQLDDLWFKMMAVVCHKYRHVLPKEILITVADLEALQAAYPGQVPCMLAKGVGEDTFMIKLVTEAEALKEQDAFRDRLFNQKRSK